jgi:hypothetical protein
MTEDGRNGGNGHNTSAGGSRSDRGRRSRDSRSRDAAKVSTLLLHLDETMEATVANLLLHPETTIADLNTSTLLIGCPERKTIQPAPPTSTGVPKTAPPKSRTWAPLLCLALRVGPMGGQTARPHHQPKVDSI